MARVFSKFPKHTTVDAPEGGNIRSNRDDVFSPVLISCTPTGVGFGPLYMGVPEGEICNLDALTFLPGNGDGLLSMSIVGAGGAGITGARYTGDDWHAEPSIKRRQYLLLSASAIAASSVLFGTAAGEENANCTIDLNIAEIVVADTTAPISLRVLDTVAGVLPHSTKLLVDGNTTGAGKIGDPTETVTVPSSTSGTLTVSLRDSRSNITRLLAWAFGIIRGNEAIRYTSSLDRSASKFVDETRIELSSHPAIVESVRESERSRTKLSIGGVEIPHRRESDAPAVGRYEISDETLVYTVGSSPPNSRRWEIETRLGALETLKKQYV